MTRLLYVQRDRLQFPLDDSQLRKWDALSEAFSIRVVTGAADGEPDPRFVPVARYPLLPVRLAAEVRRFRPDVAIAQTAYEGALLLLAGACRVVVEVHGDWRLSTRGYGSPLRRLASPLLDRAAARAIRRAAGVRTVSPYTSRLVRAIGREPTTEFPAYADLRPFAGPPRPLPAEPRALFVGVLERTKNLPVLANAARRLGPGRLAIVGEGTLAPLVGELVAEGVATWEPRLSRAEVAAALDASTVLVLPSASEGFGRVIVEAYCRGRAVVGSHAGAIPDLVEDEVTGLLVPSGDPAALAAALARVLDDPALAERLGAAAHAAAAGSTLSAEEHVARTRELVERVTA